MKYKDVIKVSAGLVMLSFGLVTSSIYAKENISQSQVDKINDVSKLGNNQSNVGNFTATGNTAS